MTYTNTTKNIDLTADTIDVRDIIERYEALDSVKDNEGGTFSELFTPEMAVEYYFLKEILLELAGNGGDEQWRGDWYPLTLIRHRHFIDHVRELLEDCGTIPADLPHFVHIDWEATARDIRVDYSPIDINGVTYWYR